MDLVKYIPSQLTNGEFRGFISYSGQPATRCGCGDTAHVALLSAQDRTNDDDESDWKTNLGATGRKGYLGEGQKPNRPRKVGEDWHHNTL
jgi:hypothetical protein